MLVVKHENRWVIKTIDGKHIGKRHKTRKAANFELYVLQEKAAVELAESQLTSEQREIRDLKAKIYKLEVDNTRLESRIEDLDLEIEDLQRENSDLESNQTSDDEIEAIELCRDLKASKERLQLGVVSEADTIKDLESQIMDLVL